MSIATKTGDQGQTGLMYNRRISKCHPRVEAYGMVDELNSAVGLARASATDSNLSVTSSESTTFSARASQTERLFRSRARAPMVNRSE